MISITVLAKNSSETLAATLDACKSFDEVILFDTGSTDDTLAIAKRYPNVKIFERPLEGFGPTHNLAAETASHDWILSIDSDEVLSPKLIEEIHALSLDPGKVYSVSRANYFRNKRIKCCAGWYPDRVVRLYHRKRTRFSQDHVHEKVLAENMSVQALNSPLYHTPYRSIESFLAKMQQYSTLYADEHAGKKNSSLGAALLHAAVAFLKNYFLKWGFLGGKEGFVISLYNAHWTYYKYLKLAWRNNSL